MPRNALFSHEDAAISLYTARMKTGPAKPIGRTSSKPRRRRVVQGVLVGIGCVALLDAFFGERGLVEMMRTRKQYDDLRDSIDLMKRKNAEMEEEIERLITNEDGAIEDAAREELGLIKRGEKVFTIREPEPQEGQ